MLLLVAAYVAEHILVKNLSNLVENKIGKQLTPIHSVKLPIPVVRPIMITKARAFRTTLVQDILECVPASLLVESSRPSESASTFSFERSIILV